MYSVNGVPLDNEPMGWALTPSSRPLFDLTRSRTSVTAPNRDGVAAGIAGSFAVPNVTLVIQTPRANLEALMALLHEDGGRLTLTASPARVLDFETMTANPVGLSPADKIVNVSWTFRVPGVFWRDAADSTIYKAMSNVIVTFDAIFPGLSAPVGDMQILVKGPFTYPLRFTDAGGSWFQYADDTSTVTTNEALVFHPLTSRVYKVNLTSPGWSATSATIAAKESWAGGTLLNNQINQSGPRRRFELTPKRGGSPADRSAVLTKDTTATTPTVFIRGRGAYLTPVLPA